MAEFIAFPPTQNFLQHRVDTLSMIPAAIATAKMDASNPGTWLAKSHVVTHQIGGCMTMCMCVCVCLLLNVGKQNEIYV